MKKQKNQVSVVLISFICLVFVNCLVNCNETIDPAPAKQGATPTPVPAESQSAPAASKSEAPMVNPLTEEEITQLQSSLLTTEISSNKYTIKFNPNCFDPGNKSGCVKAVARAVSASTGGSANCTGDSVAINEKYKEINPNENIIIACTFEYDSKPSETFTFVFNNGVSYPIEIKSQLATNSFLDKLIPDASAVTIVTFFIVAAGVTIVVTVVVSYWDSIKDTIRGWFVPKPPPTPSKTCACSCDSGRGCFGALRDTKEDCDRDGALQCQAVCITEGWKCAYTP
ncbi:MAG: hypothetical protein HY843_02580 [Bdellovibrio sp.]|nr:hypothetical protein [Bdellovibrio sp.]